MMPAHYAAASSLHATHSETHALRHCLIDIAATSYAAMLLPPPPLRYFIRYVYDTMLLRRRYRSTTDAH